MAKKRVYGFDEQGFDRVQRATRQTLGTPAAGARRRRQAPVLGKDRVAVSADTKPFTILEYDPVTGDVLKTWDRGRQRGSPPHGDLELLWSSDDYLLAAGTGDINRNNGNVIKWDVDAEDSEAERIWESDQQSLHAAPERAGPSAARMDRILLEADDGYIWRIGGASSVGDQYIARHDPDSGSQTHELLIGSPGANSLLQLEPAGSGAVVVGGTASISGDYLHRVSASGTKTHGYATACFAYTEFGGRLYVITGGTGTGLAILDATDLSVIDTRSAPVGETYQAIESDGVTVWTATTASGPTVRRLRAYDATNLAAESWNSTRDSTLTDSYRLIYANSYLYDFAEAVRKFDPTDGTEIWQSASLISVPRRRQGCVVTSGFVVKIGTSSIGLQCYEESDGSTRWDDRLLDTLGPDGNGAMATGCVVNPSGRLFVCTRRSMP